MRTLLLLRRYSILCFNYRCWLQDEYQRYGFLLPVGIILFINIIFYFRILVDFCRHKPQPGKNIRKAQLFAAISIMILMGLTWFIGIVLVPTGNDVFQYLFAIFNSTQGFMIFVLFITKDKRVRNVWRDFLMGSIRTDTKTVTSRHTPRNKHDVDQEQTLGSL